jgi:hypothetical protein
LLQVIADQEFYDDVMSCAPYLDMTLLVMPTRRLPLEQTVCYPPHDAVHMSNTNDCISTWLGYTFGDVHAYMQVATFAGRMRNSLTFLSGGKLPSEDNSAIETMASRFTGAGAYVLSQGAAQPAHPLVVASKPPGQ